LYFFYHNFIIYTIGKPEDEFAVEFFQGGLAARASIDEPIGALITTGKCLVLCDANPLAAVANLP
jgi:hypothetical protein